MSSDREKVLKKRSREAKALQKKQFRQQIIKNKKKDNKHGKHDDLEYLSGVRRGDDLSERDGREYDGLGFAGSWSGVGGSNGSGGEEPSEGNSD